jgi:addiction module HigA family antidote
LLARHSTPEEVIAALRARVFACFTPPFDDCEPTKNPPHPGDFIRTEIIEPAGLSVTAAARALRVSRPALSSLLNRKADLSGDMALRIEKPSE